MSFKSSLALALFSVLIFFSFTSLVSSYSNEGCKSANLCLGTSDKKCGKMFDKLEYSVQLTNRVTDETITYPFCITTDKFSRVTLRGSYKWMVDNSRQIKDTTVTVRIGKLRSKGDKYFSDGTNFATTLTTVLHFGAYGLDSGVLKAIDWENTCSNGRCMLDYSTNCVNDHDCSAKLNEVNEIQRDVSIFIGFRGSGRFGNIFTSANELPKTYRALSFGFGAVQFYDKARDILPFD